MGAAKQKSGAAADLDCAGPEKRERAEIYETSPERKKAMAEATARYQGKKRNTLADASDMTDDDGGRGQLALTPAREM